MLEQQLHLQGVGVVVVDLLALGARQVPLGPVVVILLEQHGLVGQRLEDGAGDGALARTGATRNAEDERRVHRSADYHSFAVFA